MDCSGFEFGPDHLRIDLLHRRVLYQGCLIMLSPRELALLAHLLLRCPSVVTRAELLSRVCNLRFDPGTNVIEVHLSRLRAKLRQGGAQQPIETVRGEGYRLALT